MRPAPSPIARRISVALVAVSLLTPCVAPAGADRRNVRNTTRTNIHYNGGGHSKVKVNRNTNVNVNVNSNRRGGYYGGGYYGGGGYYHRGPSVGGVIAATVATAIVVGAIVNSLPPNCTTVMANGFAYQNCGGTYYQPQYQGSSVSYVVVNRP